MTNLTKEIREILMTSKTVEGVYFSDIVGHARIALENFEINEVAQIIFTGFAKDPGVPAGEEDEVAPVWLHKYSFGWILGLDSGDQYAILN